MDGNIMMVRGNELRGALIAKDGLCYREIYAEEMHWTKPLFALVFCVLLFNCNFTPLCCIPHCTTSTCQPLF